MDLDKLKATKSELIDVPLLFKEQDDSHGGVELVPESGFKVVGANSQQYQDVDRELKHRNVQRTARRGRGIDASTKNGAEELVEILGPKREFAICLACIVEIYGFTKDGAPAELNEETLREIFAARPTWRTKVVAAIEAEQVFTPPSLED